MSDEIKQLQREVEDLNVQKTSCAAKIDELRNSEDPQAGIFHHQEIFSLQQEKLRLQVELEFREKKLNRLSME